MHAIALASMLLGSDPAAGASAPAPWELAWKDEFDGDTIDLAKWDLEENCWGGGNAEQQCYTRRKGKFANAFVADGLLYIVAKREPFTASNQPDGGGRLKATLPYTSARLRTKGRQEWTFGRFEIRARLPHGQGTWPAIWMLPTDSRNGAQAPTHPAVDAQRSVAGTGTSPSLQ